MTRGYRLLVLGEEGAPVRELYVSRTSLWATAIAALIGCAVMAAAGYALASYWHPPTSSKAVARPVLHQGLAARPSLRTTQWEPGPEPPKGPCGQNMVLVEGEYCPEVFHRCQKQVDPEGSALRGQRCAEYKQPTVCLSPRTQHLRFCIDRDEFVAEGEQLPQTRTTFAEAQRMCQKAGKRLCSNAEWTFACEGEKMTPYPYGFVRDSKACNADRNNLVTPDGELNDLRVAPGTFPRCQSSFGVRDLTGNVEEYVVSGSKGQPARRGGYWQPGPNYCRYSPPHSDPSYQGLEVGFRCCGDAAEEQTPTAR